ncbi:uncharacterized protein LOC132741357 [Ruditapes philippinarum]|uniref:uncharacterized protein LOC132741357 n=1 Tax=Ruditapes philippinarum TaxID=129788 RepID=UPI00295A58EE|nr:uncharacterized protein LOC132741357 [Ruditapes philippinarum]
MIMFYIYEVDDEQKYVDNDDDNICDGNDEQKYVDSNDDFTFGSKGIDTRLGTGNEKDNEQTNFNQSNESKESNKSKTRSEHTVDETTIHEHADKKTDNSQIKAVFVDKNLKESNLGAMSSLSGKLIDSSRRFMPTVLHHFNTMSASKQQLLNEIGERISKDRNKKIGFCLLYKATDKVDVEEFHEKCDAKGSTVTILYGKSNTLFGGYTSQSWRSTKKKQRVKDENAFLFTKNGSLDSKCVFFPIKKDQTENAIVRDKHFGPTFGVGVFNRYDLQTFKKDSKPESKKMGNLMKLNGSLNMKYSYSAEKQDKTYKKSAVDDDGESKLKARNINSGTMIVRKLEVFQVTDDEFEVDWLRRIEGNAFENKKRELIQMVPLSGLDIDQYNVLLVGSVGAGKSSFINTLSALITGKTIPIAQSRNSSSCVTNQIKKYDLRSANGDTMKIRFVDIRGFECGRETDKELELLIDGQLPENYQVK